MNWPDNKDFAFTITDDTDNSTLENIRPIYDYLKCKGIKITKTTWVYPSRNWYKGSTLKDQDYVKFLLDLEKNGFEVALHNVGSGEFTREEIKKGLEVFKEKLDRYPLMQINHSSNPDNIYWGYKRFSPVFQKLIKMIHGDERRFYGDELHSKFFWGDLVRDYITFIRNRVFNGINTLKYDPKMPYKEKTKPFSNFWFSASNGYTVSEFNDLVNPKSIDKLKKESGLCIVYTHLGHGFVEKYGTLNKTFKANIDYLALQNGWFAPASQILNYLLNVKYGHFYTANFSYLLKLDLFWLLHKLKGVRM